MQDPWLFGDSRRVAYSSCDCTGIQVLPKESIELNTTMFS